LENSGKLPSKKDLVRLTVEPWKEAFNADNVKSAFAKAGIYPFSEAAMLHGLVGKKRNLQKEREKAICNKKRLEKNKEKDELKLMRKWDKKKVKQ
jgi:hypothetical protein